MDDVTKRLKTDIIAIIANECFKYDDEGRRISLSAEEIVEAAEKFYVFINKDDANV